MSTNQQLASTPHPMVLFAERHTGTHFVQNALCLHPSVSLPYHEWHRCFYRGRPNVLGQLHKDYLDGTLPYQAFCKLLENFDDPQPADHQQAACEDLKRVGFSIQNLPRQPHQHPLHLIHASLFRRWDWTREVKTVVPIRDPLQVLLSHMRRRVTHPEQVIDRLAYCLQLPEVFCFPVDLWSADAYRLHRLELYTFFDLPIHKDNMLYMEQYPRMGAYADGVWDANFFVGRGYQQQVEEAYQQYQYGELHSLLVDAVAYLQGGFLQQRYEQLGYTDLPWFL